MDEKDNQDFAWLIIAGVGVAAGMALWSKKIKPWLSDLMPSLREKGGVSLGQWDIATSDVIAGAVILVMVLLAAGTWRSSRRSKKRAASRRNQADVDA